MKSAKQWVDELGNRIERQRYASQPRLLKELIEQIQADARASALREAANAVDALRRDAEHTDHFAIRKPMALQEAMVAIFALISPKE